MSIAMYQYVRQAVIARGLVDKDLLQGWADGSLDDKLASRLLFCALNAEKRALVGECSLLFGGGGDGWGMNRVIVIANGGHDSLVSQLIPLGIVFEFPQASIHD